MRALSSLVICLAVSTILCAQQPTQHSSYSRNASLTKHSAPTTCPNDPVLAADGRESSEDLIFPASTAFYSINVKGGHSYSIEVWDTIDGTAMVSPVIQVLKGDCTTAIVTPETTAMPPDLSGGFSKRVSWTQTADATYQVAVSNPDQNNAYYYQIRVADTTLHSPRWSTLVGFSTHYGFLNNTSTDINGVLTLKSVNTQETFSATVTIPAHNEAFVAIPSTNYQVPADRYGFADFTFVGSPGAITADGYFQTVTNGIFSIAPTIFVPVNYQH